MVNTDFWIRNYQQPRAPWTFVANAHNEKPFKRFTRENFKKRLHKISKYYAEG